MYNHATWNGRSFWHSTSTIFLDSIRRTGLGAVNPGRDYNLLTILNFLYDEVCKLETPHQIFYINKASIEAIIGQRHLNYGTLKLNYQHDGTYISASSLRAAFYACFNKVGSEILEKCLILLTVLIYADREPKIPQNLDILDIRQYLNNPAKPIMIEISNIEDNELLLENGDDATNTLYQLREEFPKMPISQQFEKLQFINFRLLKPIPVNKLQFYEVDFEGNPKDRNFQFYLTKIRE